jgi:hypothetical protein
MLKTAIRTVFATDASVHSPRLNAKLASVLAQRQKAHVRFMLQKEEETHCAIFAKDRHVRARNGTIATLPATIAMIARQAMFSSARTVGVLSGRFPREAITGTIAHSAFFQNMSMSVPGIV